VELTDFLSKLNKVKKSGDKYMSLCPAHDDKNLSLSITSDKEKIIVHCFAGCSTESVLQSLGLNMADLFFNHKIQRPKIVKTYDYTDEMGKLLFQVCRLEPKSFRQRHKDGSGQWIYSMSGVRRVLYHLPEVIKAPAIYFVEGEKDADNLMASGVVATTSPGGANAWRDSYAQPLYSKRVILIPDNDPPGHAYAGQVACSLRGKANVSCILLPCKDVSDWLNQGHEVGGLPQMEQPITELLWGIFDQFRLDNADLKKRVLRLEQILSKPETPPVKKLVRQVGVKID
jgi:putative DNA primase/helicase